MSGSPIDFPPPVKGIDQSLPARSQADLTCPDGQNMRGNPSSSETLTVGKRDGYVSAFTNAAGSGSGQRITGLCTALRASSTSPTTTGTYRPVVERWSGYDISTPYSGYNIGTNLRGKYVRFSRKISDYGSNGWQGSTVPPNKSIVLVASGSSFTVTHISAITNFSDSYGVGLASSYGTSNDMACQVYAYPRARSVDFVDCHNVGPFVRGTPSSGYFVWAYLERTAENQVRLVIEAVEGAGVTTIAQGDTIDLPGSPTLSNNCVIRLTATSSGVEARLSWADVLGTEEVRVSSASVRGAKTAYVGYNTLAVSTFRAGEVVTQATSGATGIVLEDVTSGTDGFLILWVTSGTFDASHGLTGGTSGATATADETRTWDNQQAGWYFKNPGTSYPGSEPGYFRQISGMDFSELVPPDPEVIAEIQGTQTAVGISRYYVPPNWLTVDIDYTMGINGIYKIVGGTTGYSTATAPRAPVIDDTLDVVYGPNTDRSNRTGLATIEVWHGSAPSEHYEIEFTPRDSTDNWECGAVFCLENVY